MSETKYLILGAGPASAWAVRGIRQEDSEGSITLVGREPYRTYSLPLLSKGFIQGRYPEDKIYLVKEDFYEKAGVDFISGVSAVSLDTENKKVGLEDGSEIAYEKLLICTGASPMKFPVPGADFTNIHYLRTLEDAKAIKEAAKSVSKAVVIGGGFIGVELACALREIGLTVELLMLEDYVWEFLTPEPVGNYLMEILRDNGVSIYPGTKVMEFKGEGGAAASVVTDEGAEFEASLFCVGIGVRPNVEFLSGTDIEIERGILVNQYLETAVRDVYAAGDVAEYLDLALGARHMTGHIENAQFQGRTAGQNMAGASVQYMRVTGYDTEVFGNMLMFLGAPHMGSEHIVRGGGDKPAGSFSFKDDRLIGALLINPGGKDIKAVRGFIAMKDVDFKKYEDRLSEPESDLNALLEEVSA